jgi:hypothetical protein
MSYCFLSYLQEKDDQGTVPDCPDGVEFLLLADLQGVAWGIFEVSSEGSWSPAAPVSDELARLIESGKRYPPALGLAREEVTQVFADHRPSQAEFANAYGTALRAHLSKQHAATYVLAPAVKDDSSLAQGGWYWVLQVSGRPPRVSWVSDDFYIHTNDIGDFDLTGQQLKQLGFAG